MGVEREVDGAKRLFRHLDAKTGLKLSFVINKVSIFPLQKAVSFQFPDHCVAAPNDYSFRTVTKNSSSDQKPVHNEPLVLGEGMWKRSASFPLLRSSTRRQPFSSVGGKRVLNREVEYSPGISF